MSDNATILAIVILRCLLALCMVCVAGYLMYQDKKGWGWLIFLAFCTVEFSVKADGDRHKNPDKSITRNQNGTI